MHKLILQVSKKVWIIQIYVDELDVIETKKYITNTNLLI